MPAEAKRVLWPADIARLHSCGYGQPVPSVGGGNGEGQVCEFLVAEVRAKGLVDEVRGVALGERRAA